ncbi:LPXTG cell wall anchor domain-containing protein [Streptomyces kaniharaensis]|uniref:LPXTG cell wall anchor domain-containing protein n=1 Tax=Streptomyces kaniharaensis TaxID=212423 RepID=A0A6N7L1D7_9ACTN|nr:LPXTG cell wall anchor domain-containing protein [Streptomyces kaniharaensis]MQS16507.1 LPXTG cell wall anchor domain-containing protein [Streptomyces kaniharaensis]
MTVAAAATLVSGVALATAPAVSAAPGTTAAAQGPQAPASPVTTTLNGPATVKAGGEPVELTATLKNTADHQVDATTGFVVAGVRGDGLKQSQLKLEYQRPGTTQWQDAKVNNTDAGGGGVWELDQFATQLHLASGAETAYRLRLTVAADAPLVSFTANLGVVVSDPVLPPEQRISQANGPSLRLTIAPLVTPSTPAPTPAARPEARLDGVPASFTAGGEAKQFKLVYTNRTGKDLRVLPTVLFQGQTKLTADVLTFEYETPSGRWQEGSPSIDSGHSGWLYMTRWTGDKDADILNLPKGETRTVNVRLSFTKNAPAMAESLLPVDSSEPGPGESANSGFGPKTEFTVEAAAGTSAPTPTVTTPTPGAPSVTPSAVPVVPVAQAAVSAPSQAASAQAVTAPAAATDSQLASTGGGSSAAPMAITGATAIALGAGALVVARRRKGTQGS